MTRSLQWIRLVQYGLTVAGVAALGYCAWAWLDARYFEVEGARAFASKALSNKVRPAGPTVTDGGILGKLEIPRLGVSVMVVEGVSNSDLRRAAGHIPGTALPNQPGNVAIAAHRDTFFRPLKSIRKNDAITLSTFDGRYRYRVVSTQVVKPDDVKVLYPAQHDLLTLVTCYPFNWIGSAPERFIVQAQRLHAATSQQPARDAGAPQAGD